MRFALIIALSLGFACGGPTQVRDAGGSSDTGSTSDTGSSPDAGTTSDAGLPIDTGHPIDAGTTPDTGHAGAQVERLADCTNNPRWDTQTQCIALRITCEDLPPADVNLRIWPSDSNTAPKGTVVLGMGGTGTEWTVGEGGDSVQSRLLNQLVRRGYRGVERAWVDGWWGGSTPNVGVAKPACRYVALIDWLQAELAAPGPTCVFGNSGGSSEIAYALSRHGLDSRVQLAVLGGGPPMGHVDSGCALDDADPNWPTECARIWNETQTECGRRPIKCGYSGAIKSVFDQSYGGTACSNPQSGDLARLRADSVLSSAATTRYPNTHVHFLHGRADCTEAPILGTPYFDAITTAKSRTLAAETPHRTIGHANGARDLVDAVNQHCH